MASARQHPPATACARRQCLEHVTSGHVGGLNTAAPPLAFQSMVASPSHSLCEASMLGACGVRACGTLEHSCPPSWPLSIKNRAMPGADSDRDQGSAGHSRLSVNGVRGKQGFKNFR